MLNWVQELGRVYINEWMKLMRRRRLWITLLLGVIVLAGLSYISWSQYQNGLEYNSLEARERYLQQDKDRVADLQEQLKKGVPEEEENNIKQEIELAKESIASMEPALKEEQELVYGDWKKILTEQKEGLELSIKEMEEAGETDSYAQQALMLNQYHLDNNIRPLQHWEGSAFASTSDLLYFTSLVFLPMLVVILVADMVSGETTSGTIKLLLVRPVSRFTILLGKWLVAISATVVLTLAFCAILFGIQLLLFGGEGADQPQMVGVTYTFEQQMIEGTPQTVAIGHYDNASIIPQYEYILGSIGLLALAMMAVATLTFFTSTWFQSAMVSTGVAFGIVIVGNIITQMVSSGKWLFWLFSLYLHPALLWTGEMSRDLEFSFTLGAGLAVLAAWTIVGLLLSIIRFQRKDILQA
ncbi:ABC transporter permease subunit [Desmospora activa]|uniref:ABC-2 type transport system permease protein n=1 Tax=Desmospora activa DSM 45169 TaxID=1121389 RepID=A0A2T4Z7E5_9BACL|nr:ABC transporter permease subunit [Desmospora activa]PTM57810.1 ABC-2 type transport system permease protein [Desmospora activa DSM 45169]